MQPYFLPYLGYFQLLRAADAFVFYGEAQYIKGGYVNRNRLLADGKPRWFSVPVSPGATADAIDEREVAAERDYRKWRTKWLRVVEAYYRRAPHYEEVSAWCAELTEERPRSIGDLAARSVAGVAERLGLTTALHHSRDLGYDRAASAGDKVIDMCHALSAEAYVNPPGGRDLYGGATFAQRGVRLAFLQPDLRPYPQQGSPEAAFVPSLSVLDAIMHCDRAALAAHLDAYTLDYAD